MAHDAAATRLIESPETNEAACCDLWIKDYPPHTQTSTEAQD